MGISTSKQGVNLSRRKLVRGLVGLTLFVNPSARVFSSSINGRTEMRLQASLMILVDIIVPRDSTPSASDLRVHKRLVEHAKSIKNYTEMLVSGFEWLDTQSRKLWGKKFRNLTKRFQLFIINEGLKYPNNTLPKVFLERIRQDTMAFYYARQESWLGLGHTKILQPHGFPSFDRAPK
jgi:hypothetical protein